LLHQHTLIACKLGRRDDADIHIQVAFAPSMRIRQSFALQANDGTSLRAFGNGNFLFAIQARNSEFGAKSCLRNTYGDRAIKVRAAALKEQVLFYIENDVEITGRRAIGAGLALIGNANTGLRIDARRNAYLDRARPLHPAASSAFRTLLAD